MPNANRRSRSRDREMSIHINDRSYFKKIDHPDDSQSKKHKTEARRHSARRVSKDTPSRDYTDIVTLRNSNREPFDIRRSVGCQTRDDGFARSGVMFMWMM